MILIWTSYFEVFLSPLRMTLLLFLSGMLGNTFAAFFNGSVLSLGVSTGIFGLLGSAMGFLIYNWKNLNYPDSPRFFWTIQVVFITLVSFLFTGGGVNIWAHLGGFIAGIFLGMCLSPDHNGLASPNKSYTLTISLMGLFLSFTFMVTFFTLIMIN